MILRYIAVFILALCINDTENTSNRTSKYLVYPPGDRITTPSVGIFVAIALPLSNRQDVFLSYNFEFNYDTPENWTEINEILPLTFEVNEPQHWQDFLVRRRRSTLTRRKAYVAIENNLKNAGVSGRACLLRTICETAEMPLHHNGLLDHRHPEMKDSHLRIRLRNKLVHKETVAITQRDALWDC